MKKRIIYMVVLLAAAIMAFFDWRLTVGWLMGWSCLIILSFFRERFYAILMDESQFTVAKYIRYILFVFIILWMPLLIAFLFPEVVNPYALAGAYLMDRMILFMSGLFTKENKHDSK